MRVINRTAVTFVGAEPYNDWIRTRDADFNKGSLTVARTRSYGSALLLPEFELEEDLQEWVEENSARGSASTSTTSSSTWRTMRSKAKSCRGR